MKTVFKRFIRLSILLSVFILVTSQAFVVRNIQINGLQNMLASTVRNYLPVHEGQELTVAKSDEALQALYKTGFFDNVSLSQRGQTLVVDVKERPMITLIKIEGNKEIATSKIQPVMKKIGLATGQIFDPLKLELFTKSLEQQYAMMGYAATSVTPKLTSISHNRLSIQIDVNEGKIVKLHSIQISGNKEFSQRQLRQQF